MLILALLLATILAACGGDEAPTETDLAPTAAAAEATVETAAEEPAGEAPAEPTEPPPAEPTTAPSTEEPAPDPTPEPAAGLTLTGDCGNAFYPVVDGRVYTYSNDTAGFGVSEYTITYSDVSDSSFTISTDVGEDEVFATTWQCTGDGLLSPEFSQMMGGMEGISIEFVEADGVTIPSEDKFRPGESWTTRYVANATIGNMGAGSMTMVETIDLVNTVAGIEAVSVPAGNYSDAVRVDTTGTISIAYIIEGMEQPPMSIEMTYSAWYVEGIGMVLQDLGEFFGVEEGGSRSELISFTN